MWCVVCGVWCVVCSAWCVCLCRLATRTPVLRRVYPVTAAAVAGRATTETTRVTTLASAPSPSPVTAAAAAERFTNKFTHELAIEFTSSVCYKFSY